MPTLVALSILTQQAQVRAAVCLVTFNLKLELYVATKPQESLVCTVVDSILMNFLQIVDAEYT